ncbi:hypothetical protein M2103_002260 [Ereboglobus sp. PH5-5]|uniref:Uncharacterized protein n=1 Tax=Ereboglobus luteus TaxID=1796921 RepID=A0A2U8E3V9_9BACT|nr:MULTISPECIES: hypothetical protein [Ereboglobus]AWI09589.1 hypothetical protein CKA38_10340 [Ereboglobus luteus]MDF9828240.1 hypothetical protein [Ereboglobus sp. PH5-10]MDF9834025.1 hypothetical protein [Ereboglobus sp. PH5-5]
MKNNRSIFAALIVAVLIALAILVAPVSATVKLTGILGYGVVLSLITMGFIEYGHGTRHNASR